MKRLLTDCDMSENKRPNLVEMTSTVDGMVLNTGNCNKTTSTDLVTLAREIQTADTALRANVSNKLKVIKDQIQSLQNAAHKIMVEGARNAELHRAACNFVKIPGSIYHLYRRPSGQTYFGMLSPEEWSNCPHEYLGSYRLEFDQSWTDVRLLNEKDKEMDVLNKALRCLEPQYVVMDVE